MYIHHFSISPYSVEIIELSVFFREQMHDNILVEQQSDASNGDMVVALIDDSATVKTFYKENGHIRLQPENDTMDPIIVPDCEILGKVFGVFRFF